MKGYVFSRPYPFKLFKGCLPQISFGPFLNSLTHYKSKFNHELIDHKSKCDTHTEKSFTLSALRRVTASWTILLTTNIRKTCLWIGFWVCVTNFNDFLVKAQFCIYVQFIGEMFTWSTIIAAMRTHLELKWHFHSPKSSKNNLDVEVNKSVMNLDLEFKEQIQEQDSYNLIQFYDLHYFLFFVLFRTISG